MIWDLQAKDIIVHIIDGFLEPLDLLSCETIVMFNGG